MLPHAVLDGRYVVLRPLLAEHAAQVYSALEGSSDDSSSLSWMFQVVVFLHILGGFLWIGAN